ncbi:MAG: hypothetical protein LBL39_00845 [Planctomycetaceae bacterium]|nr:hypothetical protein [Planctomycetaceae bacterium]
MKRLIVGEAYCLTGYGIIFTQFPKQNKHTPERMIGNRAMLSPLESIFVLCRITS